MKPCLLALFVWTFSAAYSVLGGTTSSNYFTLNARDQR